MEGELQGEVAAILFDGILHVFLGARVAILLIEEIVRPERSV